jgi:peptide-methionine (R)-S-oxide reductase
MAEKVEKTEQEWREELSPEQYRVLREKGTERAFTGAYHDTKEPGVYRCAGCGSEVFRSDTKFESGTGWPSFYEPASSDAVETERDWGLLVPRCTARAAEGTSAMSSETARSRPACATASTPARSTSSPKTPSSGPRSRLRCVRVPA